MSQVSNKKLDITLESEMYSQLWESISRLKSAVDVSAFFSDLLTQTEELMLAKRFMVAILLRRGKRPVEIGPILHVSFSTIGSVASWAKNASPRTKEILEMIVEDGDWQSILDRFETILDKLPPGRGANWRLAGKEKWQRKQKRLSRQPLY